MARREELLKSVQQRSAPELAGAAPVDDDLDHWDGRHPYTAFKAVDTRQYRLRLRPAAPPWDSVKYQYLLHMPEDDRGTFLCLVFTVLVVVIKGRNLQPISAAIGRESCSVLWQYSPTRFNPPTDPAAPFIETLDIRLETRGQVLEEAMKDIAAGGV